MNTNIKDTILELTTEFCKYLNVICTIDISKEGNQYRINIVSGNSDIFTDNSFELLYILQYLARVSIHKKFPDDFTHFMYDINDIRLGREKIIKDKIPDMVVREVLENGRTMILINLNGYERKILHNHFVNINGVSTKSIGDEKTRKLMISPTSDVMVSGIENAILYDIEKIVE